ncbi:uncharacterized protein PAC_17998 [Phialocephala subalpina]|uniref:C2H2-type domain-containing protein n=1 Tax=Phialocephala subalpina TaxID=576137 RepID=A0A1L7XSX0_9HELO|nr:uncharacterized protein PAC_17998 [Phialocephala subalpina]
MATGMHHRPSFSVSSTSSSSRAADETGERPRNRSLLLPDTHQSASQTAKLLSRQQTRHQCPLCEKSYDRHDHLTRHLRSHDNARPFQCARCQKGFNRLPYTEERNPQKPTTDSTKRENSTSLNTACVPPDPSTTTGTPSESAQSPEATEMLSPTYSVEFHQRQLVSGTQPAGSNSSLETRRSDTEKQDVLNSGMIGDIDATMLLDQDTFDGHSQTFADFFEQIMMPSSDHLPSSQDIIAPPDVSNFAQDVQFCLDDFDFQLLEHFPTKVFFPNYPTTEADSYSSPSTLSLRADAFQEWIPPPKHDSLSQQQDISINEGSVSPDSGLQALAQRPHLPNLLNASTRDKMFKVVLNICSPKQNIPTFPSQALLANVIEVFYIQEAESLEARVQPNAFCLVNTRPELLLAFIAAGSVAVNSESIQKMGMAFQEVVRLAVGELFERDNSTTRDLQALQAYMLWLDIGLWSGYKRSMEIAGSFLQPLYTLLIKANAFARSNHRSISIHPGDSAEITESVWRDWLEKESIKRLAIQAFLHDSRASLALLRNPIISYAHMNVPLPSSRDLWLAPDSQSWANMIVARTASIGFQPPLLVDVFANIDLLEGLSSRVDVYLCYLAALHATAAQVWDYKQHSNFAKNSNRTSDDPLDLLNNALQKHLYNTLTKLRSKCQSFGKNSPEVRLLAEFLMMLLHVSLDDVQRFAGKEGESSAREIVPAMREWCYSKDARIAIWHAGQVLRAAKDFQHTKLRGFHAVAVYFSALTMWVYGLIISDSDRRSGFDTPMQDRIAVSEQEQRGKHRQFTFPAQSNSLVESASVFLDEDDGPEIRSFIMFNQGRPGLRCTETPRSKENEQYEAQFCRLQCAKGVMMNAAAIIQTNHPEETTCLPPMVGNLLDLMKILGELSG